MNDRPNSYACRGYNHAAYSRRHALKVGGMGLLGLTMPRLLAAGEKAASDRLAKALDGPAAAEGRPAIKARAKSVIFLFQWGGPSHVDMFDMKPDAADGIRSPFRPIQTVVPGMTVCEHLPRMAKVMDRFTQIRTLTHKMNNHNSAGYYALSGRAPATDDQRLRDSVELAPAYGSIVDRLSPGGSELPTFVAYPHVIADGSITPGQHASYLGKMHDPLLFTRDPNSADFRLPELSLPAGLSSARVERRRELQKLVDRQARLLDASAEARGLDSYYDRALAMLRSPRVRRAFDISAESQKVRDSYGRHTYGQSCLLARRLVESGVKFVTVYFSNSIGGQSTAGGGWDTHGFNNTRMFPIVTKYHLPMTEQTLPTLLIDLEERGLLEDTLVLWMGEFGRTPKINQNVSRDHWPHCYTVLMAGGGVKGGYVHGQSDKNGALPARNPVRPDDLAATLFYLLGIDPRTEVFDTANRPLPIATGNPVMDVMT